MDNSLIPLRKKFLLEEGLPFRQTLHLLQTGTKFGDMNLDNHPDEGRLDDFLALAGFEVRDGKNFAVVEKILLIKLAFNVEVTEIGEEDFSREFEISSKIERSGKFKKLYRTKNPSDGLFLEIEFLRRQRLGLAMFNGDCNAVLIWGGGYLAYLHCGFNNVDNLEDGSGVSIIETAVARFLEKNVKVSDLRVFIGGGANAESYGKMRDRSNLQRSENLQNLYGKEVSREIMRSPRKGGIGYEVKLIAARQAEKLGISPENIEIDWTDSSAHGVSEEDIFTPDIEGTWFSNLRQVKTKSKKRRNGNLVWVA